MLPSTEGLLRSMYNIRFARTRNLDFHFFGMNALFSKFILLDLRLPFFTVPISKGEPFLNLTSENN